jgi:carbamoyltransferase
MYYSFLTSDFSSATIVSIDGVGETSTMSIGEGFYNDVKELKKVKYPHSLGLFYSAMTSFLGFKPNEGEYKVMGLASYGNPQDFDKKMEQLISYEDGTIKCNMKYFKWDKFDDMMFDHNLEEFLGIECRVKDSPIKTVHENLASSVQKRYEEILFEILKDAKELTNNNRLCLGGGCAYNGTANGKIVKNNLFKYLWIPPAPSDAGSSIGSCLHYISKVKNKHVVINPNPFLGPSFKNDEILSTLEKYKVFITYKKHEYTFLIKTIASFLNSGMVIGYFNDRIEFGARALGNRSILADPTKPYMKDRINTLIKKRENFRPFAPMVTFESQFKYFDSKDFIPYMNQVVNVREEYKEKLPAITHIDGTARVQSVLPSNPIYELLKEFEKLSKYPILLNTSFNVKDKTMVLTPEDAIQTFLETDMDFLVINNYLISK